MSLRCNLSQSILKAPADLSHLMLIWICSFMFSQSVSYFCKWAAFPQLLQVILLAACYMALFCINSLKYEQNDINIFTVFICSFMFLAPVFGYLGDRYDRKYIMIAGLIVWLVTTLGSSFAGREVHCGTLIFNYTFGIQRLEISLNLTTALLGSGPDTCIGWNRRGQLLYYSSYHHWRLVYWHEENPHDLLLLYLHTRWKVKCLRSIRGS